MRLTDAAFEGAVERYGDTVFRLAYSYLKNRADAEDVMQMCIRDRVCTVDGLAPMAAAISCTEQSS